MGEMDTRARALLLFYILLENIKVQGQDYEVADIDCQFGADPSSNTVRDGDRLSAILKKPEGFRGYPTFADDRTVDPRVDPTCQIRPESGDPTGLLFRLHISNFDRCGVLKRNGFVNVRIWFPQLPGIVMMSDQEVIIMCKPPQATVTENLAAGFASSIPNHGRISGIVEESPGRLEYVLALYRESTTRSGDFVIPVGEPVPIGTRLQLRATINTKSAWKFAKLMDVSVSGTSDDPVAPGHVTLIKNGCRSQELISIIPKQPYRSPVNTGEVMVEFEAFLLDNIAYKSQLWIHSKIKACMNAVDCLAEYCLDLYQPSGHGRKRRSDPSENHAAWTSPSRGPLDFRLRKLIGLPSSALISQEKGSEKGPLDVQSWLIEEKRFSPPRLAEGHPAISSVVEVEEPPAVAKVGSNIHALEPKKDKNFGEHLAFTVVMNNDPLEQVRSPILQDCNICLMISAGLCGVLLLSGILVCILINKLQASKRIRHCEAPESVRSHRNRSKTPTQAKQNSGVQKHRR